MGTDQEAFWAGKFGTEYIARNDSPGLLASNVALFAKILHQVGPLSSVLEIGSNIGLNLSALAQLFPHQERTGIEINADAHSALETNPHVANAILGSLGEVDLDAQFDLVLSKTVLIHIDPSRLPLVYQRIANWSRRYVLLIEYYNPAPVEVTYRGHSKKLFKRDFAGEFLDQIEGFVLADFGFAYHRALPHPQDDLTWFLLERQPSA